MCDSPRPASSPPPPLLSARPCVRAFHLPVCSRVRAFIFAHLCSRALARTASSISTSISDESDNRWSTKVCDSLCGPMIDPNSRFRTAWNICLAFFIIYCGIVVPFEIAFEADMVNAMCGVGEERLLREDCSSYLQWFWLNFLVDLWFIADIVVNFRTGCARAPQIASLLACRSPVARLSLATPSPLGRRPLLPLLPLRPRLAHSPIPSHASAHQRALASPTSLTSHSRASMCSSHPHPPACTQICKKGAW